MVNRKGNDRLLALVLSETTGSICVERRIFPIILHVLYWFETTLYSCPYTLDGCRTNFMKECGNEMTTNLGALAMRSGVVFES